MGLGRFWRVRRLAGYGPVVKVEVWVLPRLLPAQSSRYQLRGVWTISWMVDEVSGQEVVRVTMV